MSKGRIFEISSYLFLLSNAICRKNNRYSSNSDFILFIDRKICCFRLTTIWKFNCKLPKIYLIHFHVTLGKAVPYY